jgi:hypothetical protein
MQSLLEDFRLGLRMLARNPRLHLNEAARMGILKTLLEEAGYRPTLEKQT